MSEREENAESLWDIAHDCRVDVLPSDVIRMFKPGDGLDDGDPTVVVLADGRHVLVSDSIRTIDARFRGSLRLEDHDLPESERPSVFNLNCAMALTKPHEDSAFEDPTNVLLTNGETVRCSASIRTLRARMEAVGIEVADLDNPDTERPAAVVRRHVVGQADGLILLSGGLWTKGTCETEFPSSRYG